MAINVQYQPNYGLIGALSALGSASQFAQEKDQRYDQMRLQAELAKRQMFNQNLQQQRSINAQQQMAQFNRQANLEQQGIDWQQRMAQAGLQNYLQQQDNTARLQYGQQQAQAAMAKEQYEQEQMGERMKMLREMDLAAQREQEEARLAREQQIQELNFRSKAGEMEFETQMGFEQDLTQLQLNPEGQAEKQKLYEELNRIRSISDDWRASDLQQALGQWRRSAAKLWDPQYTSPPKEWKTTVPERVTEVAPGVLVFKKENGEEEVLGRPKDDGSAGDAAQIAERAMKLMDLQDDLGRPRYASSDEAVEAATRIWQRSKEAVEQMKTGSGGGAGGAQHLVPQEQPQPFIQDGASGRLVVNPEGYKAAVEQQGPTAVLKTDMAVDPTAVPPEQVPVVLTTMHQDLRNAMQAYGKLEMMPPQMKAAMEALISGYLEMLEVHDPAQHQQVYQVLQQSLMNLRASQGTEAPQAKTQQAEQSEAMAMAGQL